MNKSKIQQIWDFSYADYYNSGSFQSDIQKKTSKAIMDCKSGKLGYCISECTECGHIQIHNNSCRNRNCPNCQAVNKEIWVDKRRAEVIDSPYFHVVFTLPHELNHLIYCNQKLLYGLLHRCCAETLLELSSDGKYLGATPGIIQVLHTWNQELDYHVHIHCIVSGSGLTHDRKIRRSKSRFFIPVGVLRDKFKGKYLSLLDSMYQKGQIVFSSSCEELRNSYEWKEFKIAISNNRILSVSEKEVTFSARGRKPGDPRREITLDHQEFIRRYLMHVLPHGFQKIRYYGFLNNRTKAENLKLIFKLQGYQKFRQRYTGMSIAELLKAVWDFNIAVCPVCGCCSMKPAGRTYAQPC